MVVLEPAPRAGLECLKTQDSCEIPASAFSRPVLGADFVAPPAYKPPRPASGDPPLAARRMRVTEEGFMHRREFLIGAAAGLAAVPAWADPPKAFRYDLWPPLNNKAEFVSWAAANRGEEVKYLERRFDRYRVVLSFNDLWTAADKRAFLLTPREEFVLPQDRDQAYVGHYLDIGFGVTITPPGTMGRMTSALVVREGEKVLEIGTGSGYQSALLTYLTPRVYSIEIIPELASRTRGVYDRLIAKGYR
jgi:protein-L-isoaspartate(D-aspartate) O-methyltransferase